MLENIVFGTTIVVEIQLTRNHFLFLQIFSGLTSISQHNNLALYISSIFFFISTTTITRNRI